MLTMEFIDNINCKVEAFVRNNTDSITPDNAGLDNRCGMLYINEDAIIVNKQNDSRLQYYGGFQYVDNEYRIELGDYILYLAEDSRVSEHIERFYSKEDTE